MTRWNPNGPNIAGDEWLGAAAIALAIGETVGRGPTLTARATQSVTEIRQMVRRISGSGVQPVNVRVDVYDLANPVGPDTQQWFLAVPVSNDGVVAGGTWVKSNAGVVTGYDVNAWQNIDDVIATSTPLGTGSTDQLRYIGGNPTTPQYVRFHAGNTFYDGDTGIATGLPLIGLRVIEVEVIFVGENDSTAHSCDIAGQLVIGGVPYPADSGPENIPANSPVVRRRMQFHSNPATGLPWTNADAVALTNGTDGFGMAVTNKPGAGDLVVTALNLQFRVVPERRVATGHGVSTVAEGWVSLPLLAPATDVSAAWSKVSGHEYLLLYSLTPNSQAAQIVKIDTSSVFGLGIEALTDAATEGWSLGNGSVPLSQDDVSDGQIASVLMVGAAVSTDSLPYGWISDVSIANSATRTQRISTHSTQAYGSATIVVGRQIGGQDAPLQVRLKKASDNSVLAGPTNIAVTDVPQDGKYHIVRALFPAPASLTSGTAVYVEVQTASTVAWVLPALETRLSRTMSAADATSIAAAAAGIGGTADTGDGEVTRDYPWAIVKSPPAPTGLAAAPYALANRPALSYAGVGVVEQLPSTIQLAHLSWTSAGVGADFDHAEVQRQAADGSWAPIALIYIEASNYLYDPEGPRSVAGVARAYRIRNVTHDGGISPWANFPAVSITIQHCADVVVSSIFDPASSLAFRDLTPTHSWDQRQTARGKIIDILGRDMPVAFWPAESGGESFLRKLAVAYADPAVVEGGAVTPDRGVFDPALALLENRALPYLSYSDAWGREWLTSAAVQSPGPTREEPNGRYSLSVLFSQIESAPVAVALGTPWHP